MSAFWEYDWEPVPLNCSGIENVPMISGSGDVNTPVGGNSQWIMGFNEPDGVQPLDYNQAAIYWRQIEQTYPTKKLLSPATGNEDSSHWLTNFRNAYITKYNTPPRLDGLAVHCYRWWTSQCTDFVTEYEGWASSWGVPEIWVTEFSFATDPSCGYGASPAQAAQIEQSFISWMESQPQVTRFAWFASKLQPGTELPGCFYTPLVDWNTGQPTSYGSFYLLYR